VADHPGQMTVVDALNRIEQIQTLLAPPPSVDLSQAGGAVAPAAASTDTSTSTSTATPSFASVLNGATGTSGVSALMAPAGQTAGQRMVQIAEAEVGQSEQPPGSNDSPRIAEYRTATAGSGVGPWCAYFASWAANQAGIPLGEAGQGFGAVSAVADWGKRTGRFFEPGTQTPQPGDLIIWGGEHIGIVESVGADGSINTIEGNSSNAVSRRTYGPDGGGATGFVRPGEAVASTGVTTAAPATYTATGGTSTLSTSPAAYGIL
jgi:hypothetical protein